MKCPKCNGSGYQRDRLVAVFTYGLGLFLDWLLNEDDENEITKELCTRCDGTGVTPRPKER